MPVLSSSGVQQFFIKDLESEVLVKCENRTTDTTRADVWLRDSLLEITADPDFRNEFDELEELGPKFNLTGASTVANGAIQEYAFSNIVPTGDYNICTLDVVLWTDFPLNSTQIRLETTSYQEADLVTRYTGQPVKWYRFADTIGFVPVPDKNYQVQARIYKMHPINDNLLNQTQILIGRNWNEVLVMMAVEKGFTELLQYEKAAAVHKLLHGDPKHPDRLGMIEGRKKRREKENWRMQAALRPIVRGYSAGRGN
jgi:hypothetical protein